MKDDDSMLQLVLTGDLSPDDAEVKARCADDPEFRTELEELLSVRDLLEQDADDEREVLAPAPIEASHRFGTWMLAAAAILVVLLAPRFLGSGDSTPGEPTDVMLGTGLELTALAPTGAGASFDEFRFEAALPAGAHSELRIWSADAADTDAPQVNARFEGTSWSPSTEQLEALPDSIRWELRVFALDGRPLGSARVDRASR